MPYFGLLSQYQRCILVLVSLPESINSFLWPIIASGTSLSGIRQDTYYLSYLIISCVSNSKIVVLFVLHKILARGNFFNFFNFEKKNCEKKVWFFFPMSHPALAGYPWVSTKKFSPFCPAFWPAIGNIYIWMSCFII